MSVYEGRADSSLPGSSLRNEAASYLNAIYGNAQVEALRGHKKVDVLCRVSEFGKSTELFVEVKDYAGHIGASDVVAISADYEPLLQASPSSRLLLVTRAGLSPAAQTSVNTRTRMFHQTIWELEDSALGLLPYVQAQTTSFDDGGLSSYYVPARAHVAYYDADHARYLAQADVPLLDEVERWLAEEAAPPLAILGGYGAGKSSFARWLLARQAQRALDHPAERRPILVRLGNITRSTGLDSLLGSLFTSEYEVRGYSFRRLKELNEKGRLLGILDGFDEMKHAMTWTEFMNEIGELNVLNAGRSKVVLLGRPSAFTSDDEHLEVLRGRRRLEGGGTTRLRGWPEFREFELAPFSRQERIDFVQRYLQYATTEEKGELGFDVTKRIDQVNRLADQEPDVFGKPVHARILVELALDQAFDLSSFSDGVTRWTLYGQFYLFLARRETEKAARSQIEGRFRLEFLRRLALWLWQHRDGATAFRASDLPGHILDGLPEGDAEALDDKRREYLAGAFLERKAHDTYFFPHRSFAEFLVAEHLALHPPRANQHEDYARLVTGGVSEFLEVSPASRGVDNWCTTLDLTSGALPVDYFLFLVDRAGGYQAAVEKLAPTSCWRPLLELLGTRPEDLPARQRILSETIIKSDIGTNALLLTSLSRYFDLVPIRPDSAEVTPLVDLSSVAAAALITRVVHSVREREPGSRHTVEKAAAPMLRLAQAAVRLERGVESRSITFSWVKLGEAANALVEPAGPQLVLQGELNFQPGTVERIPYYEIRSLMPAKTSEFFHQMVLRRGSLDTIATVEHVDRRGPSRSHAG